ncbi:unnamed protein product [Penicillium camemberti]|uniref:Str. FM013 n=1 Tax=Penicillium camemberti (strain FM 013) TaxID=1429867 RepID=A0A0G4PY15_PENC3|nr:unnamed protein product [Penicillium camemberti]
MINYYTDDFQIEPRIQKQQLQVHVQLNPVLLFLLPLFVRTSETEIHWHRFRAKLATDGPTIRDSTARLYSVYLNLLSQVQAMVLPRLATTRDSGIHNFPQAFRRGRPADRLHRPLGLKIDKDYEVHIPNCTSGNRGIMDT